MKNILPIRKRLRINNYDYSKENMYFITICIKNRRELLGKINSKNHIKLAYKGNIVEKYINLIEKTYGNVIIDEYVIMPNHIHMIILINNKTI